VDEVVNCGASLLGEGIWLEPVYEQVALRLHVVAVIIIVVGGGAEGGHDEGRRRKKDVQI